MRVVPVSSWPSRDDKAPRTGGNGDSTRGAQSDAVVNVVVNDPAESDKDDDRSVDSGFYCSLSSGRPSASELTISAASKSTTGSRRGRPHRRGYERVLYAYPRLCFALVLLGSAFGTGAYAAYYLALGALDLVGARHALATARTQLVATEITQRNATTCALSQLPSHALRVRAQMERGLMPWVDKLASSEMTVRTAQASLDQCATIELGRLERMAMSNASIPMTSAQLTCLADYATRTIVRSSSSLPLAWRATLRRVTETMEQTMAQRVHTEVAVTRANNKATLLALASNTTDTIVAEVNAWLDELVDAVSNNLATWDVKEIRLPGLPVSTALEGLFGIARGGATAEQTSPFSLLTSEQLLAALRAAAGISRDVSHALDAVEHSFHEIRSFVQSLDEREAQVRQELTELRNATMAHAHELLEHLQTATAQLKQAVATQTKTSLDSFTTAVVDLLDVDHHRGLDTAWKRLSISNWDDSDLIPNDVRLGPDKTPWIETNVRLEPTFNALHRALTRYEPVVEQTAVPDRSLFRNALYDASGVVVSVVLTWDFFSRLGWFLGKIARLLTESYGDLPPVDIRDSTSITTLIDFWGVLKCRHDLESVVIAVMTEGSYVLETAVHFVLWVLVEIAGTLALMEWNQAISARCRATNGHLDLSVTTPSAVLTYLLLWIGESSSLALAPVAAVTKQTNRLDKALDEDEQAWRKQVHKASTSQSHRVSALLLEKRFLLDMRDALARCSIESVDVNPDGDVDVESARCSMASVEQAEAIASWESDAADAFHHEQILAAFQPETIVTECLASGSQPTAEPSQIVRRLEHAHGCLVDQTLYLAMASWWMVFVVMLALRLTSRMITKAAGMVFWRYLSADRVEVLAFSNESGVIQSSDRLPKAIRRHLRNIRWRVIARMFGIALGFSSVLVVGLHVLPASVLLPML